MKTSELTGALLDYWVARAEGLEVTALPKDQRYSPPARHMVRLKSGDPERCEFAWHGVGYRFIPNYSDDWAQGGPIIERERIGTRWLGNDGDNRWVAYGSDGQADAFGPTPLVAVMRAYVASRFGDEVEDTTDTKEKAND